MEEKIKNLFAQFSHLEKELSTLPPQNKEYQKLVKEYSRLKDIMPAVRKYAQLIDEEKSTRPLLKEENQEIVRMAREELSGLGLKKESLEKELKAFFLQGKIDDRDVI